jgi:hypothetical protein
MADQSVREYLSRLGKKGAEAANSKRTAAERKKVARRAAKARWAKEKGKKEKG